MTQEYFPTEHKAQQCNNAPITVTPPHPNHRSIIRTQSFERNLMKNHESETASSVDEGLQINSQQVPSKTIMSIRSECQLEQRQLCLSKNKSCSSIQNSTAAVSKLADHYTQKKHTSKTHNQYYMQDIHPKNRTIFIETTLAQPLNQKTKRTTPNTTCSQSESPKQRLQEETTPPKSPQLTVSIQHKHTNKAQMMIHQPAQKSTRSEPKKGMYYKNRRRLIDWLKNQCVKLQLSRQTFANAVFLMDSYFRDSGFNSNQFLCYALSMMVIGSKMNQKKILYTQRMAKSCSIEVQKMLDTQIQLMRWFKYRMDPYNFARIVTQFMKRWDEVVENQGIKAPLFLRQSEQSYLLFQEMFFLCENQIRNNRELLVSTIKIFFEECLNSKINHVDGETFIHMIFKDKNIFALEEDKFVFQCLTTASPEYEEYQKQIRSSARNWIAQFQKQKNSYVQKYNVYKRSNRLYPHFINIQI